MIPLHPQGTGERIPPEPLSVGLRPPRLRPKERLIPLHPQGTGERIPPEPLSVGLWPPRLQSCALRVAQTIIHIRISAVFLILT